MGFGVWGLGVRVWGFGFGVWGLGLGVKPVVRISKPAQVAPDSRHAIRHSSIVFTRNISAPVLGCGFGVICLGFGGLG